MICTDRRDFYHQFKTSVNRTLSNTVGPRLPLRLLRDTSAFGAFAVASKQKKPARYLCGDELGVTARQSFPKCPDGFCMIGFKSIFQGDHAGAEIATSAHEGILIGLLDECSRVV